MEISVCSLCTCVMENTGISTCSCVSKIPIYTPNDWKVSQPRFGICLLFGQCLFVELVYLLPEFLSSWRSFQLQTVRSLAGKSRDWGHLSWLTWVSAAHSQLRKAQHIDNNSSLVHIRQISFSCPPCPILLAPRLEPSHSLRLS
jgi:hypothetical protein